MPLSVKAILLQQRTGAIGVCAEGFLAIYIIAKPSEEGLVIIDT
jgi:hypothetical protein